MSTQPLKNLGLPPVPLELKPILGFLQRADELKPHEPVVAYWGEGSHLHFEWSTDLILSVQPCIMRHRSEFLQE